MPASSDADFPELNSEAQERWEKNARWWDQWVGDGNDWHDLLIRPATERLLEARHGEVVLELACGNGLFARRMAQLGCRVIACDSSASLVDCARSRRSEHSELIEYHLLDVTNAASLATLLGCGRFHAAVCNMAIMDIAVITPMFEAVHRALKMSGRFVFSVPHPCFNTCGCRLTPDPARDRKGSPIVKVTCYKSLAPALGRMASTQPVAHYYFNRTLSTLFSVGFKAGFVLDAVEEPAFESTEEPRDSLAWRHCPDIPPIFVARLCKAVA